MLFPYDSHFEVPKVDEKDFELLFNGSLDTVSIGGLKPAAIDDAKSNTPISPVASSRCLPLRFVIEHFVHVACVVLSFDSGGNIRVLRPLPLSLRK